MVATSEAVSSTKSSLSRLYLYVMKSSFFSNYLTLTAIPRLLGWKVSITPVTQNVTNIRVKNDSRAY